MGHTAGTAPSCFAGSTPTTKQSPGLGFNFVAGPVPLGFARVTPQNA